MSSLYVDGHKVGEIPRPEVVSFTQPMNVVLPNGGTRTIRSFIGTRSSNSSAISGAQQFCAKMKSDGSLDFKTNLKTSFLDPTSQTVRCPENHRFVNPVHFYSEATAQNGENIFSSQLGNNFRNTFIQESNGEMTHVDCANNSCSFVKNQSTGNFNFVYSSSDQSVQTTIQNVFPDPL